MPPGSATSDLGDQGRGEWERERARDRDRADVSLVLARLEGKLDVALADTRVRLQEQGRRIGAAEQDLAVLDARVRTAELGTGTAQAAIDEVRRAVSSAGSQRATTTSLVIAGASLLLTVAQRLYGG